MTPESAHSAGALLRAAREKQGLHIAALAAALKVTPRKLEALEDDRHHELDGVIFTRALAQSVCRALRVDAKPVLALLPQPDAMSLAKPDGALNMPYRDRGSRDDRPLVGTAQRLLVGAAVLLMLAAVWLFIVPLPLWTKAVAPSSAPASTVVMPIAAPGPASTVAGQADAAVSAGGASETAAMVRAPVSVASAPQLMPVAAAAAVAPNTASAAISTAASTAAPTTASTAAAGNLRIETSASSWIEVRAPGGRVLLSRLLAAGEAVNLDAATPLQLTIGNAAATRVSLRGQAVDLTANNSSNVARLELK